MATVIDYAHMPTSPAKRARLGGNSITRTTVTSTSALLPSFVTADPKYPVVPQTASFENLNDDASINALVRLHKCRMPATGDFVEAMKANKCVEGTWVKITADADGEMYTIEDWQEAKKAKKLDSSGGGDLDHSVASWWIVLKEPPVAAGTDLVFLTAAVQDKATVNLQGTSALAPGLLVFADNLVMIIEYCTEDYSQTTVANKYTCTGAICQSQYKIPA